MELGVGLFRVSRKGSPSVLEVLWWIWCVDLWNWDALEVGWLRVFFKGTSTIKSLLMHPKDPIPDAQETHIIYHWKCPTNNCTAEYIGETNRSLKERVSDHRNQTTSAIRNHHISTKHLKAELKKFNNNRKREQHPTPSSKRSTSHSYQGSITQ